MVTMPVWLLALLLAALVVSGYYALSYRARRRRRGLFRAWPIPAARLAEIDPVFAPGDFGPGLNAEVSYIGQGGGIPGGTSDSEAWILAALAKRAGMMFEFGTCTGKTTYLWARNARPDATIVTLTLAPSQHAEYRAEARDRAADVQQALRESAFERFFYTGTPMESRITQLFGDSKHFDETPYLGRCDLIFVDGSHAYSYVMSDSEKALRMCAPGGLILWHDYAGSRHAPGVFRALNELARRLPLKRLADTTLVAYRRPAGAAG